MNNLTPRAQQALALAQKIAKNKSATGVGAEHVMGAVLTLCPHYKDLIPLQEFFTTIKLEKPEIGLDVDRTLPYTPRVKKALAVAQRRANQYKHSFVGCDHIVLGILDDPESPVVARLNDMQIKVGDVYEFAATMLTGNPKPESDPMCISVKPTTPKPVGVVKWNDVPGLTVKSVRITEIEEKHSDWTKLTAGGGCSTSKKLRIDFTDGSFIEEEF